MPLSKEVYFGRLELCIYTITKNIHEGSVTPQVVPRHNWSGRTIYCFHGWSALPQVVPPFILLQMPNTGSLATCSLPSTIYMVEWMLDDLSKRLNERQLEATLEFYHMI